MSEFQEFEQKKEIMTMAVRKISPRLGDFFEEADDVNFMLQDYLNNTKFNFDLTPEIVNLLKKSDGVARWLENFFNENGLDINQFARMGLPGKDSRPLEAVEYVCPKANHLRVFRAKVTAPPLVPYTQMPIRAEVLVRER